MSEISQRYDRWPSMKRYMLLAEERTLELLDEKVWLQTGLGKQVWKDTGVFPSIAGFTIKIMHEYGMLHLGTRRRKNLKIVKKTRTDPVPTSFDQQLDRLDKHIQSIDHHANLLEVLINFALIKSINDNEYDVFIYPDYKILGPQYDTYWKYKGYEVGIESRNKCGSTSLGNTRAYVDKCRLNKFIPSMITTWMNLEAQNNLVRNNGFFCNISRLYTGNSYPEIEADLIENGFDKISTFLDTSIWGWENASVAKKWLNGKFVAKQHDEIYQKACDIFNGEYKKLELNHLYAKVNGTFSYGLSTLFSRYLDESARNLQVLDSIKLSERVKEKINHISIVYLNLLFNASEYRNLKQIVDGVKSSGYIKKQNQTTREEFVHDVLKILTDQKLVERRHQRWRTINAKSPYINKSDIF